MQHQVTFCIDSSFYFLSHKGIDISFKHYAEHTKTKILIDLEKYAGFHHPNGDYSRKVFTNSPLYTPLMLTYFSLFLGNVEEKSVLGMY